MRIQVRRFDRSLPMPAYAHPGDGGLDLVSAGDVTIKPGDRVLVPTGIAVAIPEGYAGFVQPRSGLAIRSGLGLLNSPGLIDSGYRGEIKVILINQDLSDPIHIRKGDKIAQLVIIQIPSIELVEVDELPPSDRGAGGFGSTGR